MASPQADIRCAPGPRAVERLLLDDLKRLLAARGPLELSRPVVVVVSSGTLRRHLVRRIGEEHGGAVLGVEVRTLWTVARDVVSRAGHPPPPGGELFEIYVRREARREPELAEALSRFDDGLSLCTSAVSDLASAGLAVEGSAAALGTLAPHAGVAARRRAEALLRVTAACGEGMREDGLGRMSDLLAQAAGLLHDRRDELLPARAVLVHGFADATGRAAGLIATLLAHPSAALYLDLPRDPAAEEEEDRGAAHARRFASRIGVYPVPAASAPPDTALTLFRASGHAAEARECADRVRALLDAGSAPESIGIVARTLAPYAVDLRRHLTRLGIPFSGGLAPVGLHPASRAARALVELIRRRGALPVDRWLDAWGPARAGEAPRDDLRLASRALGAARLVDLAGLDLESIVVAGRDFPLPVRRGTEAVEEGGARAVRRRVAHDALAGLVEMARAMHASLEDWPASDTLAGHGRLLEELVLQPLGWPPDGDSGAPPWRGPLRARHDAWAELDLRATRDEYFELVARQLGEAAALPLGGRGGGVQVLDLARARALTFDHLLVLGLNRKVFPRPVADDPLLGEPVRRRLRVALPHLALASERADEERYLFAQLVAAAPRVTLSWQHADDDGREAAVSPFVDRLRFARGELAPETVPRLKESRLRRARDLGRPVTASESLQLAGLARERDGLAGLAALCEREADDETPAAPDAAAHAADVLEEVDPDRRRPEGRRRLTQPGPYLGFVGAAELAGDLRHADLYVTTLENVARCPWRTLLTKLLRLEPVPDPVGALPDIDALLLGNVVHQALETLVAELVPAHGAPLDGPAHDCPRPQAARVREAVDQAAARCARQAGILLEGLHDVLAARARPLVEHALELDWGDDDMVPVVGAEIGGEIEVQDGVGGRRRVRFRADRVDRVDESLRLTDYKTGKPLSTAVRENVRRRNLLDDIARGFRLQAMAYARAAAPTPGGATGRYLFLDPEIDRERAVFELRHDDGEAAALFDRVVERLMRGYARGVLFPRLEDESGQEPSTCKFCEVASACVRHDSGARGRLRRLAHAGRERAEAEEDDVRALVELWFLKSGVREAAP